MKMDVSYYIFNCSIVIDLSLIMKFNKIKMMTNDIKVLKESAKEAHGVILSEDGNKIKKIDN